MCVRMVYAQCACTHAMFKNRSFWLQSETFCVDVMSFHGWYTNTIVEKEWEGEREREKKREEEDLKSRDCKVKSHDVMWWEVNIWHHELDHNQNQFNNTHH